MTRINPIYIGKDAVPSLLDYCETRGLRRFALIADHNTWRALGERVEQALKANHYDVTSIVLSGDEIIADERYLIQALLRAPLGECMFVSIGSGTLTDITRFVSHRSGRAFVALPTAPSVDGFTSIGAPLVLGGVKQTIICQPPTAVFADLDTLCAAPHRLVAAGYGDMIGKMTSIADWKLGSLIWNEPFDESIYARSQVAIDHCTRDTDAIGAQEEEGIRSLMESLIESGLCMLDFGSSRPASGVEHHASHYWEMRLLQEGRPAVLHGAKVGLALIHVAELYAQIRALSRQDVLDRLEAAALPNRDAEIDAIRQGYGALADDVIHEHRTFLDLAPEGFEQVKQRIAAHWNDIQALAASVPPPETITDYLRRAGAAIDGAALGLSDEETARGFIYGHYLRDRFTVLKLSRLLDLPLV